MATTEQRSRDFTPTRHGLNVFVDGENGSDQNGGLYPAQGFKTIGAAVAFAAAQAAAGFRVEALHVGSNGIEEDDDNPGFWKAKGYDEEVVIPRVLRGLTLLGEGPKGSVFIAPKGTNKTALTVHADDVTRINVGVEGRGTGGGLVVSGARFRSRISKTEGGAKVLIIGPGTVAQVRAGTHGDAADAQFEDDELAWGDDLGVVLRGSDYGAVTQPRFIRCRSHNIAGAHFAEEVGVGGSAPVTFRDLEVLDHKCLPNEDGSHPTNYFRLNANNANSGQVMGGYVPVAQNVGANPGQSLVSSAVRWVGVEHPAARSTGQPS